MQSIVRSTVNAGKGQFLKATSSAVPLGTSADVSEPKVVQAELTPKVQPMTSGSMGQILTSTGLMGVPKAISGLSTTPSYRFMSGGPVFDSIGRNLREVNAEPVAITKTPHNDMEVPDFTDYRKSGTSDPNKDSSEAKYAALNFQYGITSLVIGGFSYGVINAVLSVAAYMGPTKQTLAMEAVELKIGHIPEGKNVVFNWNGKPVFVRHRTAAEIATEEAVDVATLRDPETDAARVKDPAWLIVIGVCTHLGCVPISHEGAWGGYFCPCHGSHYDCSGRIRKGPAPLNLAVPDHCYIDEGTILVGKSTNVD